MGPTAQQEGPEGTSRAAKGCSGRRVGDQAPQALAQIVPREGLREVLVGAGGEAAGDVGGLGPRADQDDRQVAVPVLLATWW